ncbi:MAG: cytochrome d ubiquinol oxidase subunit II [Actinobacteria bacterium]|nr:cytochrome d ubiquinol oxidase subunit II [Actinomycetota bacterium]
MDLEVVWYVIIAVFWTGFFVLEGFDLGVGMLHRVVGRKDLEQRVAINAIGPFWDGNEVWLIVGAAAIFAAFPSWYASWFSALYLALMVVIVALIVRGVSFEFRGKVVSRAWRETFSWCLTIGSLLLPVLLGVALGDLLTGLPIDKNGEFTGSFFDLLTPYGLWVGVTLLALSLLHGSTFLMLKTTGVVHDRARRLAGPFAIGAVVIVAVFTVWTHVEASEGVVPGALQLIAVLAVVAAAWAVRDGHDGWAFSATTAAIGGTVASIFIGLYPNVMVSSTNAAYNLTVANSASGNYALKVMTVVAILFFPVVLLYQAWTYYVFRARVRGPRDNENAAPEPTTPGTPSVD